MKENEYILGLVTPPWYTEPMEQKLKKTLPNTLNDSIDHNTKWKVEFLADPLTGLTEESKDVIDSLYDKKKEKGWDFAVCLTDLPLFKSKDLVVASANKEKQVSMVSIPGLGAFPLKKRIRESILQLVLEMYGDNQQLTEPSADNKIKRKLQFGRFSPILKEITDKDESNIGLRFTVKSRIRGSIRMITGMVRANRPWLLFPSFMKILIIAFTTGVYALIFPTLWMLSHSYDISRMIIVSLGAITSLVTWIIVAHKLWEKPNEEFSDYSRRLYNTTTLLTLLTAVILYYLFLFVCFLSAVTLLIPMEMLESQIKKPVDISSYFIIAWMATSFSTIIGAVGSSLEKEEVVLSGTYGYRQRQRYELMKEASQEKKEAAEEKKEAAEKKEKAADKKEEAAEKKEQEES
ncbi:hypothetical protein [Gracilibacillus kekensis]|uniref:5,10-methylene-tetrahydrofolate dehydrogenase n=1 Tax=Gracilibacillus kekensis TaxID=1027249 RepID=A0A1M7QKQ6_9BACI|nr:hypothetical protein [Gracilibacillus kekensis]SHN31843.1 hypothetical protein SAMN05216179_3318 [Gracilibacillus kekensis]